jgi:5-methylcytosine-specific restriction endonuclease McrA
MSSVYEAVVRRDRGFCQLCALRGYRLQGAEIHHIVPRSRCVGQWQYLRHDIRNLAMLCVSCHHPHPSRHEAQLLLRELRGAYGYRYDEEPFRQILEEMSATTT